MILQKKQVLTRHRKLWDKNKYLTKTINDGKTREYEKDFMKIKFTSSYNFPLNILLKLHNFTIIVRSVFGEVFLNEFLYEL